MNFWQKTSTILTVMVFMFICTVFCGSQTYAVFPNMYTMQELDGVVYTSTGIHLREYAHIGGYLYVVSVSLSFQYLQNGETWWTAGTFAIIGYIVVMLVNMTVIIYCLLKILIFFQKSAELRMPNSIRAVQKRFVLLLLLQVSVLISKDGTL